MKIQMVNTQIDNAKIFELTNSNSMVVKLTNVGARITEIYVADKDGIFEDIVLGYSDINGYITDTASVGAICGRYANRIGNASFVCDDIRYNLHKNNGSNTLHGGEFGFDVKFWDYELLSNGVKFTYYSKDGEENFPANVSVSVAYELDEENMLHLHYEAESDRKTPINLTNHTYFNLGSHCSNTAMAQTLYINANFYTPCDSTCLPTGEVHSVKGTPFDFTCPKLIEKDINIDCEQLNFGSGYDHNFVLQKNERDELSLAAELINNTNKRKMSVYTTMPALQFYTSNFLSIKDGKNGYSYSKRDAVCLETQFFPDSTSHTHFPNCYIDKDKKFDHTTIFKFGIVD